MFLRGRSPMFWLLFTITLYLILTVPLDFAFFLRDTTAALLNFLQSFKSFFITARS
ncbi:hypothetical protein [Streptomyces gobitricini]|uniref:Uncharacterized protein n=1 Tax=Streptomyces gobitricini TaxID=68211 RepID=A0ABP6AF51_9ACTN